MGSPASPALSETDLLRAALARARDQGRVYPPALREQVVGFVLQRQRQADSVWAAAKELGLPLTTLQAWLRAAPAPSPFLPVLVRDRPRADSPLSLLLPGGARVEGLSLDEVAALCRQVGS